MSTQPRTALRPATDKDPFVEAADSSISWIEANRARVIQLTVIATAVLLIAIFGTLYFQHRAAAGEEALGAAMDTNAAMIVPPGSIPPGAPPVPNSFSSVTERTKAAHKQFVDVAAKYGSSQAGEQAQYFAGITALDLGDTQQGESSLKQVVSGGDAELVGLAKYALAAYYHRNGHDKDALALYNELLSKPTSAVPTARIQLAMADVYSTTDPNEAKLLYAKVKDADKTGLAGQIATQRLKDLK